MKRRFATIWSIFLFLLAPVALASPAGAGGPNAKDFVSFNGRIAPTEYGSFAIPEDRILVMTDIFIQNREPGDQPVDPSQHTTVALSGDGSDVFLMVAGNDPLNLQFGTGIRVSAQSPRILNVVSSTAPFIEYVINGYLTKRPKGF